MPERNAPCPCGSGKKYKKCCGLNRGGPRTQDFVALNRALAYKGELGRRRQAFCEAYSAFKKESLAIVEANLRRGVEEMGKSITCHRGCSHCCEVYVFADLQECENIVHRLYEHEDILKYFLQQYPLWRNRVDRLGTALRRTESAQERVLLGTAAEEERRAFDEGLNAFAALRNPCPFLKDNACLIYDIRPYVCAGVVSTNPPEYCSRQDREQDASMLLKADFQPQNDMPYFVATKAAINFGCAPAMVHQILKYGYGFLSSIDGLEDMRRVAADDPEVRETLSLMGI